MDTHLHLLAIYLVSFVAATVFRWRGVHAFEVDGASLDLKQRLRMNAGKWLSWLFTLLPTIAMAIITIVSGWPLTESIVPCTGLALVFIALMHTIPHL